MFTFHTVPWHHDAYSAGCCSNEIIGHDDNKVQIKNDGKADVSHSLMLGPIGCPMLTLMSYGPSV
eukprot:2146191-Amphidinium_carterae.1